jgi:outer membrane immunogenic protein
LRKPASDDSSRVSIFTFCSGDTIMNRLLRWALASVLLIGGFGSATAADMAVKARPAPLPAPIFSWTGFYIGVHGGGAWFDKDWTAPLTPINIAGGCPGCPLFVGSHNGSSWLVGGQAGFNYQAGMWVLGVEADGSWTDLKGSNVSLLVPTALNTSKTDGLVTLAGRGGIAVSQALFYVKGGGAWAHDRFYTSLPAAPGVALQLGDSDRWGWMVGAGVEYAFANNWSVKAEYNHLDFGTHTETLSAQPGCIGCSPFQYDVKQTVDLVKVGINYRFGWGGPVLATY